jgi:hypothetical protein
VLPWFTPTLTSPNPRPLPHPHPSTAAVPRVCSSVPATKDPKPRPAVGFCSQDFAVLFGARDPKTARQLYASGLLYNVTVPTGTPYKPPPCQGAAAAGAGVVPRAVTAAARVPTSG